MNCTYEITRNDLCYFYFPSSSRDYIAVPIEKASEKAQELKKEGYRLIRRKNSPVIKNI